MVVSSAEGILVAMRSITAISLLAFACLAFLAFGARGDEPDAAAARQAALVWTEAELADAPRWNGDEWEVDVRRANGSLVEVTLGRDLELRELDEELGPGGAPAHDELTRPLRERAIAAARSESGPGRVPASSASATGRSRSTSSAATAV